MQEIEGIGDTGKVGIKKLDQYCRKKNISIKYNKKNQICGLRKNDYPNSMKIIDIREMFTFTNGDKK